MFERRQPIQRGHRNHRPGGVITIRLSGPRSETGSGADHTILSVPNSKLVPSTQMQCSRTAILRATATFAFFVPIRFESRVPQAFGTDHFRIRCIIKVAAS